MTSDQVNLGLVFLTALATVASIIIACVARKDAKNAQVEVERANTLAKAANSFAQSANATSNAANSLAAQANMKSDTANGLSEDANDLSRQALDLSSKAITLNKVSILDNRKLNQPVLTLRAKYIREHEAASAERVGIRLKNTGKTPARDLKFTPSKALKAFGIRGGNLPILPPGDHSDISLPLWEPAAGKQKWADLTAVPKDERVFRVNFRNDHDESVSFTLEIPDEVARYNRGIW